jgi:hypothetical protein
VPIKISKARFNEHPIGQAGMRAIGEAFIQSQDARLTLGLNVRDQPAKPLSRKYALTKSKKGLKPIRDWFLSGFTRRNIKVLQTTPNRVVIGAGNSTADKRIQVNQRREPQFGASPKDLNAIVRAVYRVREVGRVILGG